MSAIAPVTTDAARRIRHVALIGNPNTGKTTLFNELTGLRQRTGNFPGVTVEKKVGLIGDGVDVVDLPGTYSLAAHSVDEMHAVDMLLGRVGGEAKPDLIVVIVDASNLARNLYLLTQVLELDTPVIVALNMMDAAKRMGSQIDCEGLSRLLGVPVIPTVARSGEGVAQLRDAISTHLEATPPVPVWPWPEAIRVELEALGKVFDVPRLLLSRALIDEGGTAERVLVAHLGGGAFAALQEARQRIRKGCAETVVALETRNRYAWIEASLKPLLQYAPKRISVTERVDALLTHRLLGTLIFALLMGAVFVTIFEWAGPIMKLVDGGIGLVAEGVTGLFSGTDMAGGMLESLLVDGVIGGVGSVLVFLPQIILLFFFIALLEDCGYMARAAFLMDRLMRFCGLSGHSFIPMMSSFACAIPGVMAARTIAHPRDRLITILVAPLMSCSARIPVYAIMIAAFVPAKMVAAFLPLQGLVFTGMYFVGIGVAIPVALILKRTLLKGVTPPFVLELPTYHLPQFKTVFYRVYEAVRQFTVRAGTIICVISVIIWALNYFPHGDEIAVHYDRQREAVALELKGEALDRRLEEIARLEAGAFQRESYFARFGQTVAPVFKPLGWDWKIGMAVLASFPAREVVVSTLGIIYDLGGDLDMDNDEDRGKLIQKLSASTWPDGRKVFSLPVALSLMVFFALCCQCGATMVTIRRETNSWKWALFTFSYMTLLAYLGALATYRAGQWFLM